MKVGIDASNIRAGGGLTHLVEILSNFDPLGSAIEAIFVLAPEETLSRLPQRNWIHPLRHSELNGGFIQRFFWLRTRGARLFRSVGCNIVFGPGGSNFTGFTPFVAMSQNMLPFEARERSRYFLSVSYIRLVLLRFSQARAFKKADGVVFLTTYARRVIEDAIGGCQGEVAIIPHGIGQKFLEVGKKVRAVPLSGDGKIKLLYVSIIDRYKHQWNVVEAIHSLRCRLKLDLQLVLAGPAEAWSLKKLAKSIRKFDAQHSWVNYIGPVAHDQLEALYAEAHVGIFASSCENMPIILLEKMGAGLPIACSSRGPTSEVAGDSVVYFDPESPASISDAVEALVASMELRLTLTTRAAECVNQFSWVNSSQSTFKFIEGIVERLKAP